MRYLTLFFCTFSLLFCGCSDIESEKSAIMNPILETIFARHSVRHFEDRAVSADTMMMLARAAMAAPSGLDIRPWQVILIDDTDLIDRLADSLPNAKMAKQVYNAVVICGDTEASHHWIVDCAVAGENLLLAAQSMGLGAVWTAVYPDPNRVRVVINELGIPDNMMPLVFIPVGYPTGEDRPKDKFDTTKIHHNKWQ